MIFLIISIMLASASGATNISKLYPRDIYHHGTFGMVLLKYTKTMRVDVHQIPYVDRHGLLFGGGEDGSGCSTLERLNFYIPSDPSFSQMKVNGFRCTGRWCQHHDLACTDTFGDCYINHQIIDNTTHFAQNCNLEIIGNSIFVYNKWVDELRTLNAYDRLQEKKSVFGNIYKRAIDNIVRCSPGCKLTEVNPPPAEADYGNTIMVTLFLIYSWLYVADFPDRRRKLPAVPR